MEEIEMLKHRYEFINPFLILNGDIVSGTMIYRNQYLESQIQKDESIIMFGAYMMHKTIQKLEKALEMPLKIYIIHGTHEGFGRASSQNFALAISRRLASYRNDVRYSSDYCLLNLAKGFDLPDYNIMAFHGWGGADYSSASPSVVREMAKIHSEWATYKNIVIQRFLCSHSHWLEIGRSVLGIRFDVTGGFMRWTRKISFNESGILYYLYDENGEFEVKAISGLKSQLVESENQDLHVKNLKYVSNILEEAIKNEIDLGILQNMENGVEKK